MIRKSTYPTVVSIIGLIVVLGIAWGSDAITRFFTIMTMGPLVLIFVYSWCYPLIALLLAAILLLLAWFVLIHAPRNVWISLAFLITGLFIVFYPALYYPLGLGRWLPSVDALLSRTSYLSSSGGFITIIGLLALVLRNGKRTSSK